MLQNAYFLAKIGADTAENEQHFAEILPKTGNYPRGAERPWQRLRGAELRKARAREISTESPAEFEKSSKRLAGGTARQRRAWDFWTLRDPRKI